MPRARWRRKPPSLLRSVPSLASEHPAIDHLRSTSGGVLHARVPCDGGVIGVVINPDGQSVETSVSLAETVMENITDLGQRGRELVAAGALEDYNAGRRFSEHSAGAGVMC